jgi:hypothetical protein
MFVRSYRMFYLLAVGLVFGAGCRTGTFIRDVSPRSDNSNASPDVSVSGRILSLAVHPAGLRVYAGTPLAGIWRSDDGGATWRQMTRPQPAADSRGVCPGSALCGLPAPMVGDVAVSPDNPDLVFAAVSYDSRAPASFGVRPGGLDGLYRSINGGETWARVVSCSPAGTIGQVAFAPDDAARMWVGTACGLFFSESGGAAGSWVAAGGFAGASALHVAVAPAAGGVRRVFACGVNYLPGGGTNVWYSDDGRTFRRAPGSPLNVGACGGPEPQFAQAPAPQVLAIEPGNINRVYLASGGGTNGRIFFGTCAPTCNEGSLWRGSFTPAASGMLSGNWMQVPSPPVYFGAGTVSGGVQVTAVPKAGGGFLLFFVDEDTVSVSDGPPASGRWHRLEGPDLSELCLPGGTLNPMCGQGSTYPRDHGVPLVTIHKDPHVFALTPSAGFALADLGSLPAAGPNLAEFPYYDANRVLNSQTCGGGVMLLGNDGGVYRSTDCGQHWSPDRNLTSLAAYSLAVVPQRNGLPALFFGTPADNGVWSSPSGGSFWYGRDTDPHDNCGDCYGYFGDPLRPQFVMHYSARYPTAIGNIVYYTSTRPNVAPAFIGCEVSPSPGDVAVGSIYCTFDGVRQLTANYFRFQLPNGFHTAWAAYADPLHGWRPLILSTSASDAALAPNGDFVVVRPGIGPTLWRRNNVAGSAAGWLPIGPPLPADATTVQGVGGHAAPTFYVAGRAGPGPVDPTNSAVPLDNLYRSHRTGGAIDGWDCIVPGPFNPAVHDGQCTPLVTSGATHAGVAWAFYADPYRPNVVYVSDDDGIKVSVDGGASWTRNASLTQLATRFGEYVEGQCASSTLCGPDFFGGNILTGMASVPPDADDETTRFATGRAGVFFTLGGADGMTHPPAAETWHRVLDTNAVPCLPYSPGFAKPLGGLIRTLYVACFGRSILSFEGIPRDEAEALANPLVHFDSAALTPLSSGALPIPHPGLLSEPEEPQKQAPPRPKADQDSLIVAATGADQSCGGDKVTLQIDLSNTAAADIFWTIKGDDKVGKQALDWTEFEATAGILPAGEKVTFAVSARPAVCPLLDAQQVAATSRLTIEYGAPSPITVDFAVSPAKGSQPAFRPESAARFEPMHGRSNL